MVAWSVALDPFARSILPRRWPIRTLAHVNCPCLPVATPATFPLATLQLRCAGCAYALRGLEPLGRCPECGTPIAETLARAKRGGFVSSWWCRTLQRWSGPPLEESSRSWQRLIGAGVLMLAAVLPLLAAWHVRRNALNYWATVPDYFLPVTFACFAVAVWLVTWPERLNAQPRTASPVLPWREIRWVLRALSPVPFIAAALAVRSEFVSVIDHPRWGAAGTLLLWTSPVLSFLLFDYLAYLAARVPAVGTAGALRLLLCAACVPTATLALASMSNRGEPPRVPELVDSIMSAMLWGCMPLGLLLYGGTFLLLTFLGLRILFVSGRSRSATRLQRASASRIG